MIDLNGTVAFTDDRTGLTVKIALRGAGGSVEEALGAALADGHWRDAIALPIQAAFDDSTAA